MNALWHIKGFSKKHKITIHRSTKQSTSIIPTPMVTSNMKYITPEVR